MKAFLKITKALADEQRLRILKALESGELCVCQIVGMLGLAASTVSKHLKILSLADLVTSRKDGRWVYYTLAGGDAPDESKEALKWVRASLNDEKRTGEDRLRLCEILKTDPDELCRRQAKR